MYTKSGKLKRLDASNYIKPTEDAIFFALNELVDSRLGDHLIMKVSSEKELNIIDEWGIEVVIRLNTISNPRIIYSSMMNIATYYNL